MLNGHGDNESLPSKVAAGLIGVTPKTLVLWRQQKKGPAYTRIVGRVYYARADINDWLARQRVEND